MADGDSKSSCNVCGRPLDGDNGEPGRCSACAAERSDEVGQGQANVDADRASTEAPALAGYRFLRELGRGGQGRVWQAIRLTDSHKVAVKLIRADRLSEPRARARFRQEYETLAQLDCAGVLQVLDHGELPTGEVWFATEYVAGRPLDQYVDDLDEACRTASQSQEGSYPLKAVLSLFAKVCEAVQAAHRIGVIHRDLKPSNILVGDDGVPRIMDFGLARTPEVNDPDLVTLTGEYLGSPAWSSPEQIAGQPAHVDVRTDVYSLGVILYRLLTGAFPYDVGGPLAEVFDRIRDAAPIPPRSLVTFVDDELQTILLKALAKERDRRYQTVADLQADVERYLRGQPVHAKGDSAGYVFRKFVRRHRAWAGAAVAVFVISLVYGTTMTVLYRRATVAEKHAEQNAAHAQNAVELILLELDKKLEDVLGAGEVRSELLESAYETLCALRDQQVNDARLDADYARTLTRLSDIAMGLGRHDDALRDRRDALTIYKRLATENPDDAALQAKLSIAHVLVGDVFKEHGEYETARQWYERALAIDETLVQEHSGKDDYRDNLSWSYERLGWLACHARDWEQARAYYAKRHELAEALAERWPDDPGRRFGLYASIHLLGELERSLGNTDLALGFDADAHQVIEALAEAEPANPRFAWQLAQSHATLGHHQAEQSEFERGRAHYRKAVDILRRVIEAEPNVVRYERALANALVGMARLAELEGTLVSAKTDIHEAIAILERLTRAGPRDWTAWEHLREAYRLQSCQLLATGSTEEARQSAEAALHVGRMLTERPDVSVSQLLAYARLLLTITPDDLRDPAQAVEAAEHAVSLSEARESEPLEMLAQAHFACGNREEAVRWQSRAIEACGQSARSAELKAQLAIYQASAAPPLESTATDP